MNKKIYLYIDTSAFKAISFNLNHPSMQIIKHGVEDTRIVILTNSILESEISSQCKQVIEDEKTRINSPGVLDSFFQSSLDKMRLTIEDGNVDLFQKTFRYDFLPRNIDRPIDWKIVFEKYFNKLPPFTEKKKSEFPDAFVIEMLRMYIDTNLHIISGDNDFHQWAESEKSITAHRSIRIFADLFENSTKSCKRILEIYKSKKSIIKGQIKSHIKKRYNIYPDFLSEGHVEVISACVLKIEISDMGIVSLNQHENAIDIEYRANGIVEVEVKNTEDHLPIMYSQQIKILFYGKVKLVFEYSLPVIKNYIFIEDHNFRSTSPHDLESEAIIQINEDMIYRNFSQDTDTSSKALTIRKRRAPKGQEFLLDVLK